MSEQICTNCHRPMEGRKRKYCDSVCRNAFHNSFKMHERDRNPHKRTGDYTGFRIPLKTIPCRRCNEPFRQVRSHREAYCSEECRRPPAKGPFELACRFCGETFVSRRSTSRFCSNGCAAKASYRANPQVKAKKVREWEAANADHHQIRKSERCDRRRRAVRGSVSTKDWLRALRRSQGHCAYCHRKSDRLTIDHVVPISRGGRHTIGNIVPACPRCNYQKHNRTVMEWRIWKETR
ncbi:HNH endonuclease [Gordonia phage IDyn]|uniref:HNH endonuclease n=1 Tax=Gordonia phage IDyn TaxID=2510506 RepID=A0A411CU43_9CAUD|nr:HNH endonuclease [Gordonia phage IDyn]QAY17349.1 HNH endonuclease [Gordonia phage IDyn]